MIARATLFALTMALAACGGDAPETKPAKENAEAMSVNVEKKITGSLWTDNTEVTGQIFRYEDFSSDFVTPRRVDIWVPADYQDHPDRDYPVLYMHDGQNLFDPQYSTYSKEEWGMDETITRLTEEGVIEPAIVVGVWSIPEIRFTDLMPQKAVAQEDAGTIREVIEDFDFNNLNGDNYLRFLVEELKPLVDREFRTRSDQANTFVMGSSMGGLMSCYAIARYPEVFGGAGCVSTHWPIGDGIVIDWLAENLPDPVSHRIYFDYGTETLDATYEPYQMRMDAIMEEAGYVPETSYMTRKYEGHPHSETAWRQRVHVPLTFFLGK